MGRCGIKGFAVLMMCSVMVFCGGCGDGRNVKPAKAGRNVIAGRVTMADGIALRGDVKDIVINISGISERGENVSYTPIVKSNGTYSQKVTYGMYSFDPSLFCYVIMKYGDLEFQLPLEHVGNLWNKRQESKKGIVQDFVLNFTGTTPNGKIDGSDIGNATHWYGESVGMRYSIYRDDLKKSAFNIPAGTKMVFTLKATGAGIDGREIAKPVTVERVFASSLSTLDINDLMPAPYEVTGVAILPDGTTHPLLFQGPGDYPNYKRALVLPLKRNSLGAGFEKHLCSVVIDA